MWVLYPALYFCHKRKSQCELAIISLLNMISKAKPILRFTFRCMHTNLIPKQNNFVKIFTVRQRSCGKVMFSQARVKNSVHSRGCLPDTPNPSPDRLGRHPPRVDNPLADPPLGRHPPRRRLLQGTVRILLECILVSGCKRALKAKPIPFFFGRPPFLRFFFCTIRWRLTLQ